MKNSPIFVSYHAKPKLSDKVVLNEKNRLGIGIDFNFCIFCTSPALPNISLSVQVVQVCIIFFLKGHILKHEQTFQESVEKRQDNEYLYRDLLEEKFMQEIKLIELNINNFNQSAWI